MSRMFTPGPWVAETEGWNNGEPADDGMVYNIRSVPGDWCIAEVWGDAGSQDSDAEANARLIAAAPELYEAANRLLDLLNDDMDPEQCAAWDALHEAIKKADGTAVSPQDDHAQTTGARR